MSNNDPRTTEALAEFYARVQHALELFVDDQETGERPDWDWAKTITLEAEILTVEGPTRYLAWLEEITQRGLERHLDHELTLILGEKP
jgi:hypothetical protein